MMILFKDEDFPIVIAYPSQCSRYPINHKEEEGRWS